MVKKSSIKFLVLFSLTLVAFALLVIAAAGDGILMQAPASGSNHTTTALFNVSFINGTDITIAGTIVPANINATFYYNLSGTWTRIGNSSECSIDACWTDAMDTSALTDGSYTINATLENGTATVSVSFSGNATVSANTSTSVIFDNTPPIVTSANFSIGHRSNYSGNNLLLNASIVDKTLGVFTIFFNITNSSGTQNASHYGVQEGATSAYSFYINTTNYPAGTYNITVWANDSLNNLNSTVFSTVIFDNVVPRVSPANISLPLTGGNYSTTMALNVSVLDLSSGVGAVFINFTNGTGSSNATYTLTREGTTTFYSASANLLSILDSNYTLIVWTNDTAGNINSTATIANIIVDNTAPTITFSCTPDPVTEGSTITCSCGAVSGVAGVNSTTYTVNPSTSGSGSHSTSCGVIDTAGNTASTTIQYQVNLAGSSSSSSSGTSSDTTEKEVKKTQTWSKVSPNTEAIMQNLGPTYGVKQIKFFLNKESNNVKVTVTKHPTKPAEVTTKSGPVYRYLEISTLNIQDSFDKATIRLQVGKIWAEDNNLGKDQVTMFKFKNNTWTELETTYVEEDADSYYYDALTDSFSFFSIGEKIINNEEPEPTPTPSETPSSNEEPSESSKLWWIILIIVVIIGAAVWFVMKRKQ